MRDLIAGTAALALWGLLGWGLVVGAKPREIARPAPSVMPCGTDQDCAEKNPTLTGLYAFPEKASQP